MSESNDINPLTSLGGENLNLLKINLDAIENPTNMKNCSSLDDSKFTDNNPKFYAQDDQFYQENYQFIKKKTKRNKTKSKLNKENNQGKLSSKTKLVLKIFSEFKASAPSFYKEFNQFSRIDKNVKGNIYSSPSDFAQEIRNVFSELFYHFSFDTEKYKQVLTLCDIFEKIYKDYDNKLFLKESKSLMQIINKLKKELRQTEEYRNNYNESFSPESL